MNESPGQLQQARLTDGNTIAVVEGESVQDLPTDLYIPPQALEVFLETFEGPLDLLLYLIRRHNLNILDIKVSAITTQYMSYIGLMQSMQLELAGEYLVMAAMLAEIKSRMLLPRPDSLDDEEGDPRAELIRRLQEYEQIKTAAQDIAEIPRMERDIYLGTATKPDLVKQYAEPEVDLKEILLALSRVMKRAEMFTSHPVQRERLSVGERMTDILARVGQHQDFVPFHMLFREQEGRMGVVVTFLAIMELVRESLLEFVQNEDFAPIHVRVAAGAVAVGDDGEQPSFSTTYGGEDMDREENPEATEVVNEEVDRRNELPEGGA